MLLIIIIHAQREVKVGMLLIYCNENEHLFILYLLLTLNWDSIKPYCKESKHYIFDIYTRDFKTTLFFLGNHISDYQLQFIYMNINKINKFSRETTRKSLLK